MLSYSPLLTKGNKVLQLLTINQAALLLLYWSKKIDDPFSSETAQKALNDSELKYPFFLTQWFLTNAIESGELPALRKPKNKAFEKKLHEKTGIPDDVKDFLAKHYDYWIAFSDLEPFAARPDKVPGNGYAHSREALARVAWILATNSNSSTDYTVFDNLAQLIEDMTGDGYVLDLGETTIKGCIREMLDAGPTLEKKDE
jgi:hypothetical protein